MDITRTKETNNHFVTDTPTLYYEQLFGKITPDELEKQSRNIRTLNFDDAFIVHLGGARGSGKSESLTWFGIKARALGFPVWSNWPIKFHYYDFKDKYMTLETTPLYFKDIFAISPDLRGGLILIDEYQQWGGALTFMSTQNRLLNAFWDQIRKNELSFYMASKLLRWIDPHTRDETDLSINCRDDFHSSRKHRRGEVIYWNIQDLSGMLTGRMYEQYPIIYHKRFYARSIWGAFNTKERFDVFEAMRGLKLDLEKTVLSDKEQQHEYDFDVIETKIDDLFSSNLQLVRASELWDYLKIPYNAGEYKLYVKRMLAEKGIYEGKDGRGHAVFKNTPSPPVSPL